MLWFKHFTSAHDDQKLSAILFELKGLEIYGLYWLILEMVALECGYGEDSTTFVEFPVKKLSNVANISPKNFQRMAETLANFDLFTIEFSNNSVKINVPNITKIRDEYSRKMAKNNDSSNEQNIRAVSGQSTERLQHKSREEKIITEGRDKREIIPPDVLEFYQHFFNNIEQPLKKEIELIKKYLDEKPLSFWIPYIKNMRQAVIDGAKLPNLSFWGVDYSGYALGGNKSQTQYRYKCPECKDDKGVISDRKDLFSYCQNHERNIKRVRAVDY